MPNYMAFKMWETLVIIFCLPARQVRTLFCDQIIFNGNIAKQPVKFRKYPILDELKKMGLSVWTQTYDTKLLESLNVI